MGAIAALTVLGVLLAPVRAQADVAPLKVVTTEVVGPLADERLEVSLVASGGAAPYRWAQRTSGGEWNGTSLSPAGVLSGTPIHGSTTTLPVRVFDATGRHADASIRFETVYRPLIQTPSIPDGYRGTPYRAGLVGTDGLAPHTWSVIAGSVPPGLEVRAPRDGDTGAFDQFVAGTPTEVGSWTFTVQRADALGRTAIRELTVAVHEPRVPDAPIELGVGYSNALAWSAPAFDGGAPITGYVVTPWLAGVAQAPLLVDEPVTFLDLLLRLPKGTYTFTVAARNRLGVGAASVPSAPLLVRSPPTAPTDVTVARGDRRVILTWTAADDGGEPIDRHWIEAEDPYGNTVASRQQAGAATTATIEGLTPGTAYRFRVRAGSMHHQGPWSAWTAPVVAAGAASAPVGAAASPRSQGAVVRWSPPLQDNGFPVTGYVVTPLLGNSPQAPVQVPAGTTTTTIRGLANGTEVSFVVAAVNAAGPGPRSVASNAVTPSATAVAPSAPDDVVALPGNGTATVSWQPPASDGGGPVTGYVVTPYVGGAARPSQTFRSAATTQTLTGLANGTTSTFRVAAISAVGTGPRSLASSSVTVGTPSAPRAPRAAPGATSATVSWTAPASNGSGITGYVITPFSDGEPLPSFRTWTAEPSAVVPGLRPGRSYRFQVAARNGRGIGARSEATASVTVGAPTTPAWARAVPGASSATVSWAPPAGGAGTPEWTTLVAYRGSEPVDLLLAFGTDTSATFDELEPGVAYTFAVAPANQHGDAPPVRSGAVTVGAPAAPTALRPLAGNGTVTITAAAAVANGSPVTSYRVTPYVGSAPRPTQTFPGTATAWKVSGLANGTVYTFRIAAVNARGVGPTAVTDAIRAGVPRAPTGVRATAGSGRATVTWTAPTNNGSAITRYVITPYLDGVAQPARSFDASTRSRVVTGLRPGRSFTFTVRAANARGTGAASAASAPVRPT